MIPTRGVNTDSNKQGDTFRYRNGKGWVSEPFIAAATQTEQEAGSSQAAFVSPGTQQYHPSAAKCWGKFTANSTTIEASYNITSIADTGTGQMTVTIATDFSGADWAATLTLERTTGAPIGLVPGINTAPTAGTVVIESQSTAFGVPLTDPTAWHFVGFGDQ